MNSNTLLQAYQQIAKARNLPELTPCGLNMTTQTLAYDQALTWFMAQQPQSGWLQTQQQDIAFTHGDISMLSDPTLGAIIHGEAMINDTTSLSLRYNGQGGYTAALLTLDPSSDEYSFDSMRFIAHPKAPGNSHYWRIWNMQSSQPMLAMFRGFQES